MGRVVEVDEDQLLADQKLRKTIEVLKANPKAWLNIEKAFKEVDPNAKTPLLDQQAQANEPFDALTKKFDDFVAETKAEKVEREKNDKLTRLNNEFETSLNRVKAREKLTDEGVKAVREIMETKGLFDAEDAWAIFERRHPPLTPMVPNGRGLLAQMPPTDTDEDVKKLYESRGESPAVLDKIVRDTLNKIRGATPR